ncbi:MAG: hypothetical protein K2Y42_19810 [Hyphomicrobium sp.]|jgi:hypothetical protein|nr:hypothetical protein [Hyphomicrobium sp.]
MPTPRFDKTNYILLLPFQKFTLPHDEKRAPISYSVQFRSHPSECEAHGISRARRNQRLQNGNRPHTSRCALFADIPRQPKQPSVFGRDRQVQSNTA